MSTGFGRRSNEGGFCRQMRLELRWLETNDFLSWDAFAAAERPDPLDCSGWFTCGVGVEGENGDEIFQVLVATPDAIRRVQQERKRQRFLVVREFNRQAIETALRDHLSTVTGRTQLEINNQLRKCMYSEYEP